MKRPTSISIKLASKRFGEHVAISRRLQEMTAQELADRANISRATLSRLEKGDPSVGFEAVLGVCRVLGALDVLVDSIDPYETDLGRARVDWLLPQRVRSKK